MRTTIDQTLTGYTDSGSTSQNTGKAPLLLVHGYPLNREMWTPQAIVLSSLTRVLAPDLRGFGETEAPKGATSMESYADDLAALLEALEIRQPVSVCGLSMGGYVALAFARKYPERLHSLILMSTRAAPDSPEAQQNRSRQIEAVKKEGAQAVLAGMESKLLAAKSMEQRPEVVFAVRQFIASAEDEGVMAALAGMRDRADSRPTLGEIAAPTLVIHGKEDGLIPPSEAEAMAEAIPGARLALIEDAGHLPNLEQPVEVNNTIREFLTAA